MEPSLVRGREALFEAVRALRPHTPALILIGAQAIQEWPSFLDPTPGISPGSKDADIQIDVRLVTDGPTLGTSMEAAGFRRSSQPDTWMSAHGVQVDLLVAEVQAMGDGRRSAGIDARDPASARRVLGLEPCLVLNEPRQLTSLRPGGTEQLEIRVARPAALLVSKLQKLAERVAEQGRRAHAKDALDVLRLLQVRDAERLLEDLRTARHDELCGEVVRQGLQHLRGLFGRPAAPGCHLLREGYPGVGATLAAQVQALAEEMLSKLTPRV